MDPFSITIGIISLVMAATATTYGIVSANEMARKQAQMQETQAKMQAANLQQQAEQEEQDQLQRSLSERRQNARRLAAAETQYAASGVTLAGTPTLALETMAEEQELEVSMMEAASNQKRNLLLTDADNALSMGIAGAGLTRHAGTVGAIGTGLSGAADLGWKTYSASEAGVFSGKKKGE